MVDKSTPITRTPSTRGSDAGRSPGRPAAGHGDEVDHLVLDLPIVGTLRLPRPEQVAYYGAVGVLVALDIVEWPIALLLAAAGHVLTQQQDDRAFRQRGDEPEET